MSNTINVFLHIYCIDGKTKVRMDGTIKIVCHISKKRKLMSQVKMIIEEEMDH